MDPVSMLAFGFFGGVFASELMGKSAVSPRRASTPLVLAQGVDQVRERLLDQARAAQGRLDESDERELSGEMAEVESRFLPMVEKALGAAVGAAGEEAEMFGADSIEWKAVMGRVPGLTEAVAMYHMLADDGVPWRIKAQIAGALLYLISPDLVPGPIDDASLIYAAFRDAAPYLVQAKHYRAAKETLRGWGIEPKPWGNLGVPIELMEWLSPEPEDQLASPG